MRDTLTARGCSVAYTEFSGGHGYINWRHSFPGAVIGATSGGYS